MNSSFITLIVSSFIEATLLRYSLMTVPLLWSEKISIRRECDSLPSMIWALRTPFATDSTQQFTLGIIPPVMTPVSM
jgi:hypothetical protein